MKNVRRPSLIFGLIVTAVFFIGFFLFASENPNGIYVLYAGLALGAIYWIWSIIEVTSADDLKKYQLIIDGNVEGSNSETFDQYAKPFYTSKDNASDFPVVTDEELLTLVQQQTFKYFYDFAEPVSGTEPRSKLRTF